MGWPARTLNPGLSGASALPAKSEARHGLDLLETQFPAVNTNPFSIIVRTNDETNILTQQNLERLDALTQWLIKQPHVTRVVSLTHFPQQPGVPALDQDQLFMLYDRGAYQGISALKQLVSSTTSGDTTLLSVQSDTKAGSSEDQAILDHLRSIDPSAKQGFKTLVGGSRAMNLDFNRTLYSSFIRTLAFILVATYILLLITFRSLFLPLKAIVMNVHMERLSTFFSKAIFSTFWDSPPMALLIALFQSSCSVQSLGFRWTMRSSS
jgi:RND superfamily putative drug exporter